jgi:MinD-like ATPase involved in chromosome partitioning or flagellar assembly
MATKQKNDSSTDVMTFTVELPPTIHEAPEEEVAVAIDDIAVQPHLLPTPAAGVTTTITLGPDAVQAAPEQPADEPVSTIPPLPESDSAPRRRVRGKGPEVATLAEPASALTAERLISVPRRGRKPAPEGFFQSALYHGTFRLVNVGDSYRVRLRKALDARIDKPFEGGTRFVAVLSRKGGVGKTTISTLLGMAMADVREDRVIAIDANPDRGTLAERIPKQTRATVRDLVMRADSIQAFSEFQTLVSRDDTRLDVLASDSDPLVADAFDEDDYTVVADLASRFYSVAITDCGTGIVHSAMKATLQRADAVVVVSGGSVDEARLASETLTWLESNGYEHLVENAVVALNTATQGTNLVKLEEIEAHFQSRVRDIVRMPYDPALATGSTIEYAMLRPITREAARDLAALVVDGLPTRRES